MGIFRGGRRRQIPHPGKNGLGGLPPNLQTKSSALENYKGQQRAYQSRKREDEYYQHGTLKLCIETTRPLRRVATQQRYDDAYNQQKMWGKEEKTGNPFPGPYFSPSPAGDIHNPAERQNNYTRHEQPDPLHSRTIGRFRYSRKITVAGRSTISAVKPTSVGSFGRGGANALQARTSQRVDADAARALAAYKDFLTLWKDACSPNFLVDKRNSWSYCPNTLGDRNGRQTKIPAATYASGVADHECAMGLRSFQRPIGPRETCRIAETGVHHRADDAQRSCS